VYSARPTVLPRRSVPLFINVICRSGERPARQGSRKSKSQKIVRTFARPVNDVTRLGEPTPVAQTCMHVLRGPVSENCLARMYRATSSGRGRCNVSERIRRICYYYSEQGRLESATRSAIVVPFACYFCRINFVVVVVAINDKPCRIYRKRSPSNAAKRLLLPAIFNADGVLYRNGEISSDSHAVPR